MTKRVLSVLLPMLLVALAEPNAVASCAFLTYFAPESGARVPPGATTYVFPSFSSNVVIRVTSGGQEVPAYSRLVDSGIRPVIAVTPETTGMESYTVEARYIGDGRSELLASTTYHVGILARWLHEPDSEGGVRLERVKRLQSEPGLTACVSYDLLDFWVDVDAPAYRFEWARSEQAYRDGDRHVAIVERTRTRQGANLIVGVSGCGQNVLVPSNEKSIFVGIAPLGFGDEYTYRTPAEPIRIDVQEVDIEIQSLESRLIEEDDTIAPLPVWEGRSNDMFVVDERPSDGEDTRIRRDLAAVASALGVLVGLCLLALASRLVSRVLP